MDIESFGALEEQSRGRPSFMSLTTPREFIGLIVLSDGFPAIFDALPVFLFREAFGR